MIKKVYTKIRGMNVCSAKQCSACSIGRAKCGPEKGVIL